MASVLTHGYLGDLNEVLDILIVEFNTWKINHVCSVISSFLDQFLLN